MPSTVSVLGGLYRRKHRNLETGRPCPADGGRWWDGGCQLHWALCFSLGLRVLAGATFRHEIPSPRSVVQQGSEEGTPRVTVLPMGRGTSSHPPCAPGQDFVRATNSSRFAPMLASWDSRSLGGACLAPSRCVLCEILLGQEWALSGGEHVEGLSRKKPSPWPCQGQAGTG